LRRGLRQCPSRTQPHLPPWSCARHVWNLPGRGSWVKRCRSWPHHAISRASIAPDPGFRQPSWPFGQARTAAAMAIVTRNSAHINDLWHVTIGAPCANAQRFRALRWLTRRW
jgi:hypothetical protein